MPARDLVADGSSVSLLALFVRSDFDPLEGRATSAGVPERLSRSARGRQPPAGAGRCAPLTAAPRRAGLRVGRGKGRGAPRRSLLGSEFVPAGRTRRVKLGHPLARHEGRPVSLATDVLGKPEEADHEREDWPRCGRRSSNDI